MGIAQVSLDCVCVLICVSQYSLVKLPRKLWLDSFVSEYDDRLLFNLRCRQLLEHGLTALLDLHCRLLHISKWAPRVLGLCPWISFWHNCFILQQLRDRDISTEQWSKLMLKLPRW